MQGLKKIIGSLVLVVGMTSGCSTLKTISETPDRLVYSATDSIFYSDKQRVLQESIPESSLVVDNEDQHTSIDEVIDEAKKYNPNNSDGIPYLQVNKVRTEEEVYNPGFFRGYTAIGESSRKRERIKTSETGKSVLEDLGLIRDILVHSSYESVRQVNEADIMGRFAYSESSEESSDNSPIIHTFVRTDHKEVSKRVKDVVARLDDCNDPFAESLGKMLKNFSYVSVQGIEITETHTEYTISNRSGSNPTFHYLHPAWRPVDHHSKAKKVVRIYPYNTKEEELSLKKNNE